MELEKVFIDIELEGRKKSIDYVYVFCTPYKKGIKKIVVNGLLIFQCVKNKTYFIKTIDNSHEYYKGIFSNYERKKVFLKKK